jgi:hypothetical protein
MKRLEWSRLASATTLGLLLGFGVTRLAAADSLPKGMFRVKPVAGAARPASRLAVMAGQYFSYALPEGWQVAESGQYALTLVAPDRKALTVMVGNAGMPSGYPPARFAYEKLMALQPENLQLGNGRPVAPIAGFASAYTFEVNYLVRGVPCRGVVTVHVAPAYDSAVMAMTAALSQSGQWSGYASWLPLVAAQVSATNGAAFGMRGVMAQNLQNSTAYAEAAQQYRDWSQRNWQQVTNDRNAAEDRKNTQFRENLGAVQSYVNPYDNGVPVELPTTYQYYWVDAQGSFAGTNDPSVNPNVGATEEWKKMPKRAP